MHHALSIEEIVLEAFSYLHPGGSFFTDKDRYSARATLAALARTCRTFKEPALNVLWSELDDLSPLVRCLSEPWVERTRLGYSLRKVPRQTQWCTILGYARRVHALPRLDGSFGLARNSIIVLSNPPSSTGSILPNLRSFALGLWESGNEVAPLMRHLASPKLTDVYFRHIPQTIYGVQAFGKGCPMVTNFFAASEVHNRYQSDTISSLICRWQNLRSVDCLRLSVNLNALSHLSRLPNLCSISCVVDDILVNQIQLSASPLVFSALHVLRVDGTSFALISGLLHHFRLPTIHNIAVTVSHRQEAQDGIIPDLIALSIALQEACARDSLNDLLLSVNASCYSPSYITFDCLAPLTVFANIKSITVLVPLVADLNEKELLYLTSSWPHLETFRLGAVDCEWAPSSGITPAGFVQLLEQCRSLKQVHIKFNTEGYTVVPQGHPWRGLVMPEGTHINLLNSVIKEESVEALSHFFRVAPFPHFVLSANLPDIYPLQSSRNLYFHRWEKVYTLARNLWQKKQPLGRPLKAGFFRYNRAQ